MAPVALRGVIVALAVALTSSNGGPLWAGEAPAGDSSLAALHATRERPLFAPTRRPPPPTPTAPPPDVAQAPPPAPVAPPPTLDVSGVIMGDDVKTALVRDPHGSAILHLTVGSQIDGWTVAAIHRRDIVLQRAERSITIAMPESHN